METIEEKKERLNVIKNHKNGLKGNEFVKEYLESIIIEEMLQREIKDKEAEALLTQIFACSHLFYNDNNKCTCIKCGLTNDATDFTYLLEPYVSKMRAYILEYFKDFNPVWLDLYISKYFDSLEEAKKLFASVSENENIINGNEIVSKMLQLKRKKG